MAQGRMDRTLTPLKNVNVTTPARISLLSFAPHTDHKDAAPTVVARNDRERHGRLEVPGADGRGFPRVVDGCPGEFRPTRWSFACGFPRRAHPPKRVVASVGGGVEDLRCSGA